MNRTNSKWFTNKKFIVASLLIAFAVSIFSAFAFNMKTRKVDAFVSTQETTEQNNVLTTEVETPSVSFSYSPNAEPVSSNKAQPMASVGTASSHTNPFTYSAWWDKSNMPNNNQLLGGTTIKFNPVSGGKSKVQFTGSSTGYVQLTINPGWSLTGYDLKVGSTVVATYSESSKKIMKGGTDCGADITTEELVTSYTEGVKIEIVAKLSAKTDCQVELFYEEGNTYAVDKTVSFGVNGASLGNANYDPDGAEETVSFEHWVLVASAASASEFTTTEKTGYLEVKKDGVEWRFEYDSSKTMSIDNAIYGKTKAYKITKISGYTTLTQDSSHPFLLAKWSPIYDIDLNVGSPLWTTDANYKGTDKAKSSYGITGQSSLQVHAKENAYYFTIDDDLMAASAFNKTAKFFKQNANAVSGIYSYGQCINNTDWTLRLSYGATTQYFSINNQGKWSYGTSSSRISSSSFTKASSAALAEFLNSNGYSLNADMSAVKLTLIPSWSAASIKLINGKDTEKTMSVSYNRNYAIQFNSNPTNPGQELFGFATQDNASKPTIALGGNGEKWNYTEISGYAYENGQYNLTIYPVFLDNIYKVTLKIEPGLEWNSDTGVNSYTKLAGSNDKLNYDIIKYNTAYSPEGTSKYYYEDLGYRAYKTDDVFTENYIEVLQNFKDKYYNYISDADINPAKTDNVLRICYEGAKNTTDATDGKNWDYYYVYLASGQGYGNLPAFKKQYHEHISWDTTHTSGAYAYKTSIYTSSKHSGEYPTTGSGKTFLSNEPDTTWSYKSTNRIVNTTLEAHFFRKYFILDVKTILNNNKNDHKHYGFVLLTIIDDYDGQGEIGAVDAEYFVCSNANGSGIEIRVPGNTAIQNISEIKFYAGSTLSVTLYDQSNIDYKKCLGTNENAYLGSLDKTIIGYKKDTYSIVDASGTTVADAKNYDGAHKSKLTIYANFGLINYTITVKVDTSAAGTFDVSGVDSKTGQTSYAITVTRDQIATIIYNAAFGYTLKGQAITLGSAVYASFNGTTLTDGTYTNGTNKAGIASDNRQQFEINTTPYWLDYFYYARKDTTYEIDDATTEAIQINTTTLTFNYSFVDKNGVVNISSKNGTANLEQSMPAVVGQFISGDYSAASPKCEYSYNGSYYTIVASQVKGSKGSANAKTYFFPIGTISNDSFIFNATNLSAILAYTPGVILTDLNVTFELDFREITDITVKFDTAYVDTLIKDTKFNAAFKCSNYSVSINYQNATREDFKVYDGCSYTIVTTSGNLISGADYYAGRDNSGMLLRSSNAYDASSNYNEIFISPKFIAIPDKIGNGFITYKLYEGGTEKIKTLKELQDGGYLDSTVIDLPTNSEYLLNSNVQWKYKLLKEKYELTFDINGESVMSNADVDPYTHIFEKVLVQAYLNKLEITVTVREMNNNEIVVPKYYLATGENGIADFEISNFGTVNVFVDGVEAVPQSGIVKVYKDQKLQFDITGLLAGYEYNNYINHAGSRYYNDSITTVNVNGQDRILLTIAENYDTDNKIGNYAIEVVRKDYVVNLDTSASGLKNHNEVYQMGATHKLPTGPDSKYEETTSETRSLHIQVGYTLTFSGSSKQENIVGYFYKDKSGAEIAVVDNILRITSELLNNINPAEFTIYTKVDAKYKLDIVVASGSSYLPANGGIVATLKDSGESHNLDNYVDKGTIINVVVNSEMAGQYIITVVASDDTYSYSGTDSYNKDITMNKNITLTVSLTAKTYNVTTVNYIYSTINELYDDEPAYLSTVVDDTPRAYDVAFTISYECKLTDKVIKKVSVDGEELEIDVDSINANTASTTLSNGAVISYRFQSGKLYMDVTINCTGNVQMDVTYASLFTLSQE